MLAQCISAIVERWGDVEFVQSKTSTIQSYAVDIWDFITEGFWGPIIVLLAGLIILAVGVRKSLGVVAEYQDQTRPATVGIRGTVTAIIKRAGPPPSCEFVTHNRQIECDIAIQSVRFIEPIEKVIRPDNLPAFVSCEPRRLKRIRNSLLGIHPPRITVKSFTATGIIIDEENTDGANVILEFYGTL